MANQRSSRGSRRGAGSGGTARRPGGLRAFAPLLALLVLVVVLVLLVQLVMRLVNGSVPSSAPVPEQCVVQVGGVSDELSLEQSGNAAIIVGESIRRGLPARAASIALATAMQESKLSNINYGDRDSVGLFQQRPSQGWGTAAQIMDPWYASGKFYEHLVKVPNWQTGDLNDVAQAVQRSGVPDGYRQHVDAAKAWASALTGHSPAAVSCVDQGSATPASADGVALVRKALGSGVRATPGQAMVTFNASSAQNLWAATQLFMLTTGTSGVTNVAVGSQTWTMDPKSVAAWQGTAPAKPTEAVVTLRA